MHAPDVPQPTARQALTQHFIAVPQSARRASCRQPRAQTCSSLVTGKTDVVCEAEWRGLGRLKHGKSKGKVERVCAKGIFEHGRAHRSRLHLIEDICGKTQHEEVKM